MRYISLNFSKVGYLINENEYKGDCVCFPSNLFNSSLYENEIFIYSFKVLYILQDWKYCV